MKLLDTHAFLYWTEDNPFNRMLIAQARAETMTLVTGDSAFGEYGAPLLWG